MTDIAPTEPEIVSTEPGVVTNEPAAEAIVELKKFTKPYF